MILYKTVIPGGPEDFETTVMLLQLHSRETSRLPVPQFFVFVASGEEAFELKQHFHVREKAVEYAVLLADQISVVVVNMEEGGEGDE